MDSMIRQVAEVIILFDQYRSVSLKTEYFLFNIFASTATRC